MEVDIATIWRLNHMRDLCQRLSLSLNIGGDRVSGGLIFSISGTGIDLHFVEVDEAEDWLEARAYKKDEEE